MTTNSDVPSGPQPKAAYTIHEVAQLLGLHRATVSAYVNTGELRAARLGHRTVRITHEALIDFLRAKEVETQAELSQRRRKSGTKKSR
jgi:excisionase family DNA binding protein